MRTKRITIACFLLAAALSLNTLHAYDPPALYTSPTPIVTTPTPQGVPTSTAAPTVAIEAPTVAPVATFPPTVTALPASGMHADWRPMMALGALLFLAVSGCSLWYLHTRSKIKG